MNKSMLLGAGLGAVSVVVIASATHFMSQPAEPQFAPITAVKAVTKTNKTPVERCETVAVTKQRPVQDQHKIAGTALGAAIGGVLGNQVGGGSGKKAATAVGAVAGGYAGNQVQGNMQANDTYVVNEQRCRTEYQHSETVIGYDVHYTLNETAGVLRTEQKPTEKQLPVKEGVVVDPSL